MNTPDLVSLQARVRRAGAEPTDAALRTSDEFAVMTTVSLPCTSQARRGPLASRRSLSRLSACLCAGRAVQTSRATTPLVATLAARDRAGGLGTAQRARASKSLLCRRTSRHAAARCSGHNSARLVADCPPHFRVGRCSPTATTEARAGTRSPRAETVHCSAAAFADARSHRFSRCAHLPRAQILDDRGRASGHALVNADACATAQRSSTKTPSTSWLRLTVLGFSCEGPSPGDEGSTEFAGPRSRGAWAAASTTLKR
jgi:hypothetical protein